MKKIIIVITIIFFISGCATVPKKMAAPLEVKAIDIDGISYLSATTLLQNYDASYKWDPLSRKFSIQRGNNEAVFCVGSNIVLINNRTEDMESAAKMHSGEVMIPLSFVRSALNSVFLPSIAYSKKFIEKGKYSIRTIVLDAGHGGRDPGAISTIGIREKDIVLSVAKKIKSYLEDERIRVILTRDSDKFIPLAKRADIANKYKADFFISIHANSAKAKQVSGIEVYYLSEAVDDLARATAAAENKALDYESSSFSINEPRSAVAATLWDMLCTENRAESIELSQCISKAAAGNLKIDNRGVKAARFYVLKGAQMPAVLIEIGFLSNREEAVRLKTPDYQWKLAKAIASGIFLYKERYEKTDGFTR